MKMKDDNDENYLLIHLVKEIDGKGEEKRQMNRIVLSMKQFENEIEETNSLLSSSRLIIIFDSNLDLNTFHWKENPQIHSIINEQLEIIDVVEQSKISVENFLRKTFEENRKETKNERKKKIFTLLKNYWFLIGLIFVIYLSYLFPDIGKSRGLIRSEWTIKWFSVCFIFLLSGLGLKTKDFRKEILHIRLHLFIQFVSFVFFPLFIYFLCFILQLFSFHSMLLVGFIVLSSTSTTISSNVVMTKNAHGNECGALINAILGNLSGIFLSPLLISFIFKNSSWINFIDDKSFQFQFEYFSVISNLCLTVLLPFSLGQILHLIWTEKILYFKEKFYFAQLNSVALLTLIWSVFSTSFANKSFDLLSKQDLCILILLNIFIYLFSSLFIFSLARLPIRCYQYKRTDTITMIFCGATKTLAMGIPLINAIFSTKTNEQKSISLISLPLIVYHVIQLIFGAFQVIILKHWIDKSTKKENIDLTKQIDSMT